jgi:NAD(P)H-flavin reductase/hemoglobin-like flavoprotein
MDIAALKTSWADVAAHGDEVPLYFYSHLFVSHPDLREMFPIQMTGQRDKLVAALGHIVSNVDQLDDVVPFIEQLGRDHRRFSVTTDHYAAVGASLLATLHKFLGSAWTADLADSWAEAYGLVAKVMVAAAEKHEDLEPAFWEADVVSVERRSIDVAVVELEPREPYSYAPGQSIAIEVPQRPRLWRYFSPANAPRESGRVELHVQPVDGGQVSPAVVRKLAAGDTVRMGAPVGERLTLPAGSDGEPTPDLLMVAGGTGLAPLRAVLEQIDQAWEALGAAPRVHLFHGARLPWNLYDHKYLSSMKAARSWFDYTPVVSEDSTYPGVRGLVGEAAANGGPWDGRVAMVCGSPGMVAETVSRLVTVGVPSEAILTEQFDYDRPAALTTTGGGAARQEDVR